MYTQKLGAHGELKIVKELVTSEFVDQMTAASIQLMS